MTDSIKIISAVEFFKKNKKLPSQEEVWDEISDLWNSYRKEPFDAIKDFLKNKKGRVIDLGCGSGRNMVPGSSIEYYGVDISKNQVLAAEKNAKEKGINAKLFKSSAGKLDISTFKDEMFDLGLFIATLHCIEGKKERENALKEFFRVLKPGAEGIITVWNSDDLRFNSLLGDIYMSWKRDGKDNFRYYYLFSKDELYSLIKKVGFNIVKVNDSQTDRFSRKNLIIFVKK